MRCATPQVRMCVRYVAPQVRICSENCKEEEVPTRPTLLQPLKSVELLVSA